MRGDGWAGTLARDPIVATWNVGSIITCAPLFTPGGRGGRVPRPKRRQVNEVAETLPVMFGAPQPRASAVRRQIPRSSSG